MSIILPRTIGPNAATPSYVDYGGILRPVLGGPDQKLNRLGDRYALSVTMPPLQSASDGRIWISRLIQAQKLGAVMDWPQLGFLTGLPGGTVVDAAGQLGSTLALRGGTPAYAVREGQFFSIIHNARRYLHMATAQGVFGSDGKLSLPIAPMLRIGPFDAAICEFASPKIEGFLEGNSRDWTLDLAQTVGLSFRIVEAQ